MGCVETHATLRIFSETMSPEEISGKLNLEATRSYRRDPGSKYRNQRETNGWFWSTQGLIESTVNDEHIQTIVTECIGKYQELLDLRAGGCTMDISNYWVGDGQGGPILSAEMMGELSRLGLDIWWDNYFEMDET